MRTTVPGILLIRMKPEVHGGPDAAGPLPGQGGGAGTADMLAP